MPDAGQKMLDDIRSSIEDRLNGYNTGGDIIVMGLIDKLIEQQTKGLKDERNILQQQAIDAKATLRVIRNWYKGGCIYHCRALPTDPRCPYCVAVDALSEIAAKPLDAKAEGRREGLEENQRLIQDMAMLIRRMARKYPGELSSSALGFLLKHGLSGSVIRDATQNSSLKEPK